MFIGVVGKPNVGKSTFFKSATLMDVEIANYPFATIEPNTGVGFARVECVCKDFDRKCNPREGFCTGRTRYLPVKMVDVAGLVPGAYEGKGMGNQFLEDLRDAHCLIHVIDISASTNEKGENVEPGSHDPLDDVRFLENELDMWYMNIFMKVWQKFSRTVKQEQKEPGKEIAKQFAGLRVNEDIVKSAMKRHDLDSKAITDWSEEDLKRLVRELRIATKPIVIAANKVDMGMKNLARLKERLPGYTIIGCSAEAELALREGAKHDLLEYYPGESEFTIKGGLSEKQQKALQFIKSNVLDLLGNTGVQQIIDTCIFEVLGYIAVFPGGINKLTDQHGNVLPDCYLMPPGSTALDFAYKLHTDFGKNFIKAINVKTKLPVGKDNKLSHRDVIEIMSR